MNKTALIIEDDDDIARVVAFQVKDLGFTLERAETGPEGVSMALSTDYAFIILDIMLPGIEGVEVCKQIREKNKTTPILMLTARSDVVTEVLMLELGADSFVAKPFEPAQLKAHLKALIRRATIAPPTEEALEPRQLGKMLIDLQKRRVTLADRLVELTPAEYEILVLLTSTPGRPHSRAEITEAVYGCEVSAYEKSITSHINRLRSKIEPDPANPRYLLTIRGVGYCFSDVNNEDTE